MSGFDTLVDRVLLSEGNFTDDPRDPGNWTGGNTGKGECKGTNFGISARSYPTVDIRRLTRAEAVALYRRDFWDRVRGDDLDMAVAFQVFDAAVNHGIGNAVRWLQDAAGVAPDGAVGPVTRAAVQGMDPAVLLLRFNAVRLRFYTKLSTFDRFGKGWANRLAGNLDWAAKDVAT